MKESELAFWQKTARHYTRSMDRSAPLYAAVCERIRPHLSRDMNVLEKTLSTLIQRPVSFESGLNWFQPCASFESGFTFAQ